MRTKRGLFSTTMTIALLGASAYFGIQGRKSALTPETTLSQVSPEGQQVDQQPIITETKQTQVVVPPVHKEPAPPPAPKEQLPTPQGQPGEVFVQRDIDGDTIELANGERVRFIGVNTPETVDPRKPVECFGPEAKEFTKNLLEGQWVRLETDVDTTDKYGRTLAYVWRGDVFVNDLLVHEGYAQVMTIPPNVRYADQFRASEQFAKVEKKGLWSACGQ